MLAVSISRTSGVSGSSFASPGVAPTITPFGVDNYSPSSTSNNQLSPITRGHSSFRTALGDFTSSGKVTSDGTLTEYSEKRTLSELESGGTEQQHQRLHDLLEFRMALLGPDPGRTQTSSEGGRPGGLGEVGELSHEDWVRMRDEVMRLRGLQNMQSQGEEDEVPPPYIDMRDMSPTV
jgi:hypothetical protein